MSYTFYQPKNTNSYELNIISKHSQFNGKRFKKHMVEGIETIGVWGDEPFEIEFKNHSYNKVQVRLSLDGVDILTGEKASTLPTGEMWVVNAKDTLRLKAYPESNQGGAAFVFTSADNSVVAHTHGDMTHQGIIAAAVFTEGYVEPPTYWNYNNLYTSNIRGTYLKSSNAKPFSYETEITCSVNPNTATMDSLNCNVEETNSAPAIGAGQYVAQQIEKVAGLRQPQLSTTIRMRYVWFDDLKKKVLAEKHATEHRTGFPGDPTPHRINLGSTPRLDIHPQTTYTVPASVDRF